MKEKVSSKDRIQCELLNVEGELDCEISRDRAPHERVQ